MEDTAPNTIALTSQQDALHYVDTVIRPRWGAWIHDSGSPAFGEAVIIEETLRDGKKAWQYHIEGLPVSRDGRKRWVLEDGTTFDTTLSNQ